MGRTSGRVTLEDVAKATGYTINTVSRALKNKEDISRETCEKIQKAAREMGYVRNYIASSLRSGRTKTIAMIAGSMTNPFYAILADLIQQEAVRLGYSLMILCSRDDPETETRMVEMALSRQADGILITPCSFDSPALELLRSSGTPFVLLSRYMEGSEDDCVICDDEQGGYLAARHLLAHGHRNLAMISFHQVVFSSRKRFEGFHRACLEEGIPENQIHYAVPENDKDAVRIFRTWQEAGVTALFCFCDAEAWSVITLMESAETGRPFALVGFDNIQRYIHFPRPLCTIDPCLHEEAAAAIDLLRKRIHHPSLPTQRVFLSPEIVCRNCCGVTG